MIAVREHLDTSGRNRYRAWFDALDIQAATRVTVALERIAQGNISSIKGVGEGVYESKIDFGPGYRIYFGKDGDRLVILLGGGTKRRQDRDIADAKELWREYKSQKKSAQKQVFTQTEAKPKDKKRRK